MDYDHSKAYGGKADASVVSSVGGTHGSHTQATGAGTAMVEGAYLEDASFDAINPVTNASCHPQGIQMSAMRCTESISLPSSHGTWCNSIITSAVVFLMLKRKLNLSIPREL